ncbi:MAG: domain containing protein [Gemmatimonadetes bacterium]|nr:domain containing protein [Gemmatimonadota bacterium]
MRTRVQLAMTGSLAAILGATALAAGCGSDVTAPAPVVYTATLSATNERQATPVNSTATGISTLTLRGNDSLDFTVMVTGLTAAAIASHIHVGDASVSGPIVNGFVINSGVTTGTVAAGTIILSKLVPAASQISGDSLRVLLNNGNAYVNVHTSTFGAGEIRGQVVKQ